MGLKTFRVTVNVPDELEPLIEKRVTEEHYKGKSAYFMGLLLFDLSSRCRHKLTSQMMAEPPAMLDRVVKEIVREFDGIERGTGDWLRIRLEELLAERAPEKPKGKAKE